MVASAGGGSMGAVATVSQNQHIAFWQASVQHEVGNVLLILHGYERASLVGRGQIGVARADNGPRWEKGLGAGDFKELLPSPGTATTVKLTKPSLSQILHFMTMAALCLGHLRRPNPFPLELLRPRLPFPLK